ncbi:DUF2946 domain-containing protein [Cribrihabitans pelagius]|uniref:DUF2946 domain-containing protein n=1 Tax=Cribrihabitans pelagius TaxID=1765746 RepID=UPI003B5C8F10
MPAPAADGKMLMVTCTGGSMVETWADLGPGGDGSLTGAPHEAGDRSCPFPAIPASALLPEARLLPAPAAALAARFEREAFTRHSAGFHGRYDTRGRPHSPDLR